MIEIANSDDMKARMTAAGFAPVPRSMEQVVEDLVSTTKEDQALIDAAKIKLE